MKKILLVAPTEGNGGIQSWTRKYIKDFNYSDYSITHINVSQRRSTIERSSYILRAIDGLLDLISVYKKVYQTLKNEHFDVFHTTTSGDIGTLRDFMLCRLCKRHKIKTILHCRYGCIPEDFIKKNLLGFLLRKTMRSFDNVWVLDSKSLTALKADHALEETVKLVPNPIRVPLVCNLEPKDYTKVAFIGNMYKTKGIMELVDAVSKLDNVTLHIVGPNYNNSEEHIRQEYESLIDKRIHIHGKLPNDKAIRILEDIDILALPTYYPWEAFPISILEATSRGKMVISTHRAAIPDMLTDTDGKRCGCIVDEKSPAQIADAIKWCQNNKIEADNMCRKAYEKTKKSYDTSIIYKLYHELYDQLTSGL